MIPNRALAEAVAKTVEDVRKAVDGPRCDPQENAALTKAALIAIREIAKAAGSADKKTEIGQWRHNYDSLAKSSTSRTEFLEEFVLLTESLDSTTHSDLPLLCLIESSKNASMAAYAEFPRELRLDALRNAGIAIGALTLLQNPKAFEPIFKIWRAKRNAAASHKIHYESDEAIAKWLSQHHDEYKSDRQRAKAINDSHITWFEESTIPRKISAWRRAQRSKNKTVASSA